MELRTILKIPGFLNEGQARILQKYVIEQQKRSKSDLLEVGSWKGLSSIVIASLLSEDRRLWVVDHFRGSPEHQEGQRFYTLPKYTRRNKLWIYPEFLENVIKYNAQNKVIVLPLSSEKAAKVVDEKFCFIFIDGDHQYESVSQDGNLWLPHLEKNGVIIFHDYGHPPVRKFCNELKKNEDLSVLHESSVVIFRKRNLELK